MLSSSDAWQTNDRSTVDRDSLEREQSPACEERRSFNEGTEARLTELAAPQVTPEQETGDDLEDEESLAKTDTNESNALAEVAAPEPVAHTQHQPAKDNSEEEKHGVSHANHEKKSKPWIEMATIGWLIFFSFLGTLARLGVEAIATYPYAFVPSTVLWANMGGSFLMGFLLEDRRLWHYSADPGVLGEDQDENRRHIDKSKKTLPLYIGLTTGFCGSFTSFSTFITDAFLALSNDLAPASPISPYHSISANSIQSRNGGYSLMALLAVLIVHTAVSIAALKTGAHVAVGTEQVTPSLPSRFIQKILDPLGIVLGIGCWVGAVLLTVWPIELYWRRSVTMALVFAPLGALSRFYISRHLNARVPQFPLGTFAINVFGACVEGMCFDLQHTSHIIGNVTSGFAVPCAVLEGVMQGYCGCATTVSTWVVELNALRRRHAWLYGMASVGVSLGFQIAIMGSVAWTAGFDQSCSA
ncbi:hypothetical protein LTS08_005930 [Lithohypha guttulata]|uniref:uncharacterized protein n=1 Tax=Lithohypha guttulata TaxID=1690604 RepID=UPI002DDFDC6B|nr:hypothetical protein LTR51_002444 [Lithohypha guttulata]KAK5099348.1 hypothetical protein LTS08_005930 [Lithohypha guttulata]